MSSTEGTNTQMSYFEVVFFTLVYIANLKETCFNLFLSCNSLYIKNDSISISWNFIDESLR